MSRRRCAIVSWCVLVLAAGVMPGLAGTTSVHAVGVEWISFHYEEPGTMEEYGSMYGVFYANSRTYGRLVIGFESSLVAGTIRYDGALMDGTPYEIDTEDLIFKFRSIIGSPYRAEGSAVLITPYMGLAYRYLMDDLPPPYGYLREQSYVYAPVGVRVAMDKGRWHFGAAAEYELFLGGHNLSGGDSFTQDSGYGYEVTVAVGYVPIDAAVRMLTLEAFYRYWDVAESSMSPTGYIEPENSSSIYGIRSGIEF